MAEEKVRIIVSVDGARASGRKIKDLKKDSQNLTGAFIKAELAVRALEAALRFAGRGFGTLKKAVKDSLDEFNELEQGALGIARTMDVTRDEALEMTEALLNIETPTSIEELQDISRIAGSLGVAKDEALEFTAAVDEINVALGDEFTGGADEITGTLGKISSQFGLVDDEGRITADSITRIGSAINELGKEGIATGPFISNFTERLGAIAPQAGISAEDVLGLAAAMEELGQRPEESSRAIQILLTSMGQDLESFANAAEVDVDRFTKLFREDANEAMLVFAESVRENNGNFDEFSKVLDDVGIGQSGATKALFALGSQTDKVRDKQALANKEFEKATSIGKEFELQQDSTAASQERFRKQTQKVRFAVGGLLSKALNPLRDIFSKGIGRGFEFVKGIFEEANPIFDETKGLFGELAAILSEAGMDEEFKEIGKQIAEAISDNAVRFFGNLRNNLKALVDYLKTEEGQETLDTLKDTISEIGDFIVNVIERTGEWTSQISDVTDKVGPFLNELGKLASILGAILGFINDIVDKQQEMIGNRQASSIAKQIGGGIPGVGGAIGKAAGSVFNNVTNNNVSATVNSANPRGPRGDRMLKRQLDNFLLRA